MNVLLVEDDPILARSLQVNLDLEGYRTYWAPDLKTAYQRNTELDLSLVILDLGLPDGSGFQFLQKIRESQSRLPVIILTAQTDEDSVVKGLELGANDFVKKPFGQRELFARIKSVLKEPLRHDPQVRYGDLMFLVEQRKLMCGDRNIELNRREYDILLHLVEHADAIVTRGALLAHLDKEGEIFDRTVDSHISHLRSRLKQNGILQIRISSVYGVGYRLEKV